jgi:hypothetical protein
MSQQLAAASALRVLYPGTHHSMFLVPCPALVILFAVGVLSTCLPLPEESEASIVDSVRFYLHLSTEIVSVNGL